MPYGVSLPWMLWESMNGLIARLSLSASNRLATADQQRPSQYLGLELNLIGLSLMPPLEAVENPRAEQFCG